MLTSRNGGTGIGYGKTFICWSCQVQAHQRRLSTRAPARRFTTRPNALDSTVIRHRQSPENEDNGDRASRRTTAPPRKHGLCDVSPARGEKHGSKAWPPSNSRSYRTFSRVSQQNAATSFTEISPPEPTPVVLRDHLGEHPGGIRAQLRQWNELHGYQPPTIEPGFATDDGGPLNAMARLQDGGSSQWRTSDEESVRAQGYYAHGLSEGENDTVDQPLYLGMGDLVEIPFPRSERESVLAVFVRRVGGLEQCYTSNGRWVHTSISMIPYSIPGWISPKLIEPILSYLPDAADLEDREALSIQARMEDLSVPRVMAAPIVERLLEFERESLDIYRRNAGTLDLAHDILAHDTDLRYGSLTSAAVALLKTAADQLSAPALYTVRKAISNAGFGFNIERTAHRLTGYMQILPKAQVALVERVREHIRQWQEDSTVVPRMSPAQRARHKTSPGTRIIETYIAKAKGILSESRKTRTPTVHGVLGPSKVRIPITPRQLGLRESRKDIFTPEEQDITRFIEAWSVTGLFRSHPRLSGLVPLLLQATGLYPDLDLSEDTGYIFLQELGTFLPFDNHRCFDPNLLLPTSQHSRPLMVLQSRLNNMSRDPGFVDTMAGLRHDWEQLPVYCIDKADAKEIDDGLSVEPAEDGPDGRRRHWVHVHVANPTAFFDKESAMAKMARHMGESVYTPERTYPMLPPWVPNGHFSLGPDRPCLTISVKLDEDGTTLEHRITSGIVRNVLRLTPDDTNELLGMSRGDQSPQLVLTVGGQVPSPKPRRSAVRNTAEAHVNDLRILQRLAQKRFDMRKASGGIFFDIPRPDVRVYVRHDLPGLGHMHPFRIGSRIVEGDPVIEYRTAEFSNWFAPKVGMADTLVREMMVLACETSARWCAERNIPIVYRGTTANPDGSTPEAFHRDVLVPQVGHDGEIPMHLGLQYMRTLGPSALHWAPVRHDVMGVDYYTKATSPLRRYGDMILHWQVQAALLHEAETGESLLDRPDADRSFLPFSAPGLSSVMRGLKPRERTIMLAKRYTERYWFLSLLMRRHVFGEDGGFPFETLRVMTTTDPYQNAGQREIIGLSMDLNFYVAMKNPQQLGLGKAKMADVWECKIESINIYMQKCIVTPIRLLERPGG